MSDSFTASEFYARWPEMMGHAKTRAPDAARGFGTMFASIMKDGALTLREKELIALGIAIALRCENCIYAHVEKCFKAGVTGDQVMDAAAVAVMMQGGPGYVYLPKVLEAVEHFERQQHGGAG